MNANALSMLAEIHVGGPSGSVKPAPLTDGSLDTNSQIAAVPHRLFQCLFWRK